MRLVQITIPSGKRETLLSTLEDEGVDYVVSDETSNREYAAIAYVPLPANAVEQILESLREAGLSDDDYTVVLEANTVISRRFEELQERYAEEEDEDRIAREELTAAASGLSPGGWTYAIMTAISAIIATAGLLLDSAAVVVGSMVIAPLVGPALSTGVGTVVGDREMFRRGAKLQVGGVLLAIVAATVFAILVRFANVIPPIDDIVAVAEISERVAPDFLALVIALGAGAAGIISLTSGVSTALVGVMIAAALIPPAATVGIGIAWGKPLVTVGAGVLVAVNVLSINLAGLVVLWYKGYRPGNWFREDDAKRSTVLRVSLLVIAMLTLSAFLGGITYDSFQRAGVEADLREGAVAEVRSFSQASGVDLRVLETRVEHSNTALFQRATGIEVTVGVPPGESPSGLAGAIDERADRITGRDVTTEVRYVTVERAGA